MSPNVIVPAVGACSVATVRISVDLPAPFGPEQAVHAARDRQADVVERDGAVGISVRQIGDFEHRVPRFAFD